MKSSVQYIIDALNNSDVLEKKGQIVCDLAGIKFIVNNRDILGGIIQTWFDVWMTSKNIKHSSPENSQTWPDFYLDGNIHLEVKSFNYQEGPGFDIANFSSYIRSLTEQSERLNDSYLIFGYIFDGNNLSIKEYWLKNVWEITGPSEKHHLSLQVKQNRVSNIRPKDWRTNKSVFKNRRDFVIALSKAAEKFGFCNQTDWFNAVEKDFKNKTKSKL